jgi:hypothetical protein
MYLTNKEESHMLDGEVYLWLESRTGQMFDCSDTIKYVKSNDLVVVDPNDWMFTIRNIIDITKRAIDAVDEFGDELPDTLPGKKRLQSLLAQDVRAELRVVMHEAFRSIGLMTPSQVQTASLSNIWTITITMVDLIVALTENSIDEIIKNNWYEEYNEDHDDVLNEVMHIYPQDLPNIAFAIEDIREMHDDPDSE